MNAVEYSMKAQKFMRDAMSLSKKIEAEAATVARAKADGDYEAALQHQMQIDTMRDELFAPLLQLVGEALNVMTEQDTEIQALGAKLAVVDTVMTALENGIDPGLPDEGVPPDEPLH